MSINVYALYLELSGNDLRGEVADWALRQDFPLSFKLPCGSEAVFNSADDIPLKDTPCPCGDGRHWLVKYA